ncbi:MAG: isochorismatase family protein [Conchiformibius sp.]|nr:isochorismatase family protein [Conchiformibius sp.]
MLKVEHTAALVIDIQERLLPVLAQHDDFQAACVKLLNGLQALSVPVLATEQYPKGLGATVPAVRALLDDKALWEKTRFSAYIPEVAERLQQLGVKNIVLLGCEAHICMLQTVWDLRQAGFQVYLPQECAASRTEANRLNGLQQAREAGAVVSNVESLLFALMGDAKHPAFKTISKLIV